MRPVLSIAAAAALLSLVACETDTSRRQGRSPSRYEDTTVRPSGEARPNDSSPMRGDETYPGTSGSPGIDSSTGTSGADLSGSQIDRGSSVDRSGRRSGSDTTVRPRTTPSTPSDESAFENPYGLNAAKNPRDAGMTGGTDGGTRYESSPDLAPY